MLSKILTWLADWIASFFTARADQQAVTIDKKSIDEKLQETKPILDNIEELKAQKNAKSGEVKILTEQVKVADEVVANADAETKTATAKIKAIKQKKGITQSELASKLDKLNLDDTS